MDYMDIIKRAWRVTWRYKVLWLFGLFAGAGGSGGGNGGGNSGGGNSGGSGSGSLDEPTRQFLSFVQDNIGLIIAVSVFLVLIGVVWWIVSIAARGGIIKLVDDAEDGRPVRASEGWSVGFSKWLRIFGIQFLAGLPALVLVIAMIVVIAIGIMGAVGAGAFAGREGPELAGVILSSLGGMCFFLVIFIVLATVLGVILGIVEALALRYAVLEDRGVIDSLKAGWSDLWAKRGAFVMYLCTVGVGIGVGIVGVIVLMPGILAIIFGNVGVGSLLLFLGVLVLMVPSGIYGAFYHAMWTIFFRRMTGRERTVAQGMPEPVSGFPPPPPAGIPAPPAWDEPPAAAPTATVADATLPPAPWEAPPPPLPTDAAPAAPADPDAPADPWKAANDVPGEPPADA